MIAPLGYVVGYDFVVATFDHINERLGKSGSHRIAVNILVGYLARFLRECPSTAVYLPDQTLVRAADRLFATRMRPDYEGDSGETSDIEKLSFQFLSLPDLKIHTSRAAKAPRFGLIRSVLIMLNSNSGPVPAARPGYEEGLDRLNGGYLVFKQEDLPTGDEPVLDLLIPDHRSTLSSNLPIQPSANGSSDLAARIVALVDAGEIVIRDEARARLAPDLNTEAWKEEWKAAAQQRPELSKRGPKRSTKREKPTAD